MIDQDRDGLISVGDLKEMYSNLGKLSNLKLVDIIQTATRNMNIVITFINIQTAPLFQHTYGDIQIICHY